MVMNGEITPGIVFAVFWAVLVGSLRIGQAMPQVGTIVAAKVAAGDIFSIIDKVQCFIEKIQ